MNIKEAAETFALNQWLSDYPDEWDYQTIIEAIKAEDYQDDIFPWVLIENETGEKIADFIEATRWSFEHTFNAVVRDMVGT